MESSAQPGPAIDPQPATPTAAPLVPFGVACRMCAFDLKQLPITGTCPECNARIQDSLPGYTPEWTIADSRPCLNCQYDLVGLHLTGVCPECGSMLTQSINGNLLRYSGFTYVKTLQTGVKSINWSINSMMLIYVFMFVIVLVGMVIPALAAIGAFLGILAVIAGFVLSAYFAIAGWWKISVPDPRNLTRDSGENIRKAIRTSLIVYLAMIPASMVIGVAEVLGAIPAPYGSVLAIIVSMLAFTILLIGTMKYIQRIAYRVPSVKLQRRARAAEQLMMLVIYGYVVILLGAGAMAIMPPKSMGLLGAIVGVAAVLVALGSLFSLHYFSRSLKLAGKVLGPVLETTEEPNQMSMSGSFGLPKVPDAA